MLYPHEDRLNNVLLYRCRTCQATESATNYCVFRNVLGGSSGETAGVITDIGSDPTLPRSNKACPYCHETEAVFFQSQQRTEDTKMVSGILVFFGLGWWRADEGGVRNCFMCVVRVGRFMRIIRSRWCVGVVDMAAMDGWT